METFGETTVDDDFLSKYHNLTIYFDNRDTIDFRYMHGNVTIPCALLRNVLRKGAEYELAVGVHTTSVNDSILETLDAYSYQSIFISWSDDNKLQFEGRRDIRSHGEPSKPNPGQCRLGKSLWIFS